MIYHLLVEETSFHRDTWIVIWWIGYPHYNDCATIPVHEIQTLTDLPKERTANTDIHSES